MTRPVLNLVRRRLPAVALAAGAVLTAVAALAMGQLPPATAAPAFDDSGYVDSTARCAAPNKAVAFGHTASSRIAICKDEASGQYQYRGVRVSDGATLILPARSTDRGFVADNDGITYTVTAKALVVSAGGTQLRDEPMVDFHGTAAGASSPSVTSSKPPSTSAPSSSKPSSAPTQPSAVPETVTPSTPLPPPLPAEVGGGGNRTGN